MSELEHTEEIGWRTLLYALRNYDYLEKKGLLTVRDYAEEWRSSIKKANNKSNKISNKTNYLQKK